MSLLLALTGGQTDYSDSLSAGSYSVTGKSITDGVSRYDALSGGAYALTGQSITDVKTSSVTNYADDLSTGSYSVTGQSITDNYTQEVVNWGGGAGGPVNKPKSTKVSRKIRDDLIAAYEKSTGIKADSAVIDEVIAETPLIVETIKANVYNYDKIAVIGKSIARIEQKIAQIAEDDDEESLLLLL